MEFGWLDDGWIETVLGLKCWLTTGLLSNCGLSMPSSTLQVDRTFISIECVMRLAPNRSPAEETSLYHPSRTTRFGRPLVLFQAYLPVV